MNVRPCIDSAVEARRRRHRSGLQVVSDDRAAAVQNGDAEHVVARGAHDVHGVLRCLHIGGISGRAAFQGAAHGGQRGERLHIRQALRVPVIDLIGDQEAIRPQRSLGLLLESRGRLGVAEGSEANCDRRGDRDAQAHDLGGHRPGSDAEQSHAGPPFLVFFGRLPSHGGFSLLCPCWAVTRMCDARQLSQSIGRGWRVLKKGLGRTQSQRTPHDVCVVFVAVKGIAWADRYLPL